MSQGGELEVDVWSTSDVWGPITRATPPVTRPRARLSSAARLSIGFIFVMCLFRDNRTVKAS